MNAWTRRCAALGTAVALGLGLAGCSGGAQGTASTVKEAFTSYVSAINAGDYAKALTFVDDAKGATADNIVRLSDSEIPEPLIKGEEPSKDVESADVDFTVGSAEPKVSFVKRDGGWKLKNPALVEAYDLSNDADILTGLSQIADVAVKSPTGQTMPTKGFVVKDGNSTSEAPQITVELAGKYGLPDQEVKTDLEYGDDGFETSLVWKDFDDSSLVKPALALLSDNAELKTNYISQESPNFHIQQSEIESLVGCSFNTATEMGKKSDGTLYLGCNADGKTTTEDGSPYRQNVEGVVFHYADDRSCYAGKVSEDEYPSQYVWFQIADGKMTVLWDEKTERLTQEKKDSEAICGIYSDLPVGTVLAGVVPKSGETPDTTVSDDLASLVSKAR